MQGGHPYYEKMAHNHAGAHSHSGHGHTSGTQTAQTTVRPASNTSNTTQV